MQQCSAKQVDQGIDRSGKAGVAQLVERNLAKVEVASSSLVVRSVRVSADPSTVGWPRGEATDCKSVYTGSNPVSTSNTVGSVWDRGARTRAIGAVVARFVHTEEVTGSNPVSPTLIHTLTASRLPAEVPNAGDHRARRRD